MPEFLNCGGSEVPSKELLIPEDRLLSTRFSGIFPVRVPLRDLQLVHLGLVYPGTVPYPLDDRLSAVPVHQIPQLLARHWPEE